MNINELHQLHLQKLVKAFGVANAQAQFSDDRAARAVGNHYASTADPDTSREEI
jgi:hypothetical protein